MTKYCDKAQPIPDATLHEGGPKMQKGKHFALSVE